MAQIKLYPFGYKNKPTDETPLVLGNKGHGLVKLTGLWPKKVPPGVIIPCSVYREWQTTVSDSDYLHWLADQVMTVYAMHYKGELFSVRSGAPVSMPGMMDTVLGVPFKRDAIEQALWKVYASWGSERAVEYRAQHNIPHDLGTAAILQVMVNGDRDLKSCSGVMFTRDPDSGEDVVAGEYLPKTRGDVLVSGKVTPVQLEHMEQWNPKVLDELLEIAGQLESIDNDMQEVEFTVERGRLWLLQVRKGKRTARAAFRIAKEQVDAGILTREQAFQRVTTEQFFQLKRPMISAQFRAPPIVIGLPACGGVAVGRAVFSREEAEQLPTPYILIRPETAPEDFPVMSKAAGVITMQGGATSHAAVVCRSMNIPAIVGIGAQIVKAPSPLFSALMVNGLPAIMSNTQTVLDGTTGKVWFGKVPLVPGSVSDEAQEMVDWAAKERGVYPWVNGSGELLPNRGYVYLRPNLSLGKKDAVIQLEQLLAQPKLCGVIGIEQPSVSLDAGDAEYLMLLGIDDPALVGYKMTGNMDDLLRVLGKVTVSAKALQRWSVHIPDADADTVALLEQPRLARWSTVASPALVDYAEFLPKVLGR